MPNSLANTHPQYASYLIDWTLMRDTYRGERQVKSKGNLYLPFTASQIQDKAALDITSSGYKVYQAYLKRARFPNFTRETIH